MASCRNIVGVTRATNFRYSLQKIYKRTLQILDKMPKDSAYRKHTYQILCYRLSIINELEDRKDIEAAINCGRMEMLIWQAHSEYSLSQTMLLHKVWEPLVLRPPPDQWKWPQRT